METPQMLVIDLEIQVREAFYERFSVKSLQGMLNQGLEEPLLELAWDLAPTIFPEIKPQAVIQLTELAADWPELMTKEPENSAGLRFDYDILSLTPLRFLHANVVDLIVRFGKDEVARMPRIAQLSGDSRHVYNMMQRHYVTGGFISHGCVSIEAILREVFRQIDKIGEEKAQASVKELIKQGFAIQSSDEVYQLSLLEKNRLIERYHLGDRWPDCCPLPNEVADVQHAMKQQENAL